jgi:hypothetical protein
MTYCSHISGLGHYECESKPTLVKGEIEKEKIVHIAGVAETVMAVSGKYQGDQIMTNTFS